MYEYQFGFKLAKCDESATTHEVEERGRGLDRGYTALVGT
jgi:hypothetical protein